MKIHNYCKNMVQENIIEEFILKNIDDTRNYFLEDIKQNDLMRKKHKKISISKLY